MQTNEFLPVEHRYLEILSVPSQVTRLTVNPRTGRVTLKIPEGTPDEVREIYHNLANMVLNDHRLPPLTLRGVIEYLEEKYEVQLLLDSKIIYKIYVVA